jgi:peptide-methionine (S)-S-oxide reductase
MSPIRIGFGGGCHWCTEAVFQSLRGVSHVAQGSIRSFAPHDTYSESVIVIFDPTIIPQDVLIDAHLRIHASTSPLKMRGKYRSAIYAFNAAQQESVEQRLYALQVDFAKPLVTGARMFNGFKPSPEQFQDYYRTNMDRPFCQTYIDPKLNKIRQKFGPYFAELTA